MDYVPVIFIIFKIFVLGAGMFFAIKWHYDQDKKTHKGEVISAVGKMAVILMLSLLGLLFATFMFARMLGLDLTFPR